MRVAKQEIVLSFLLYPADYEKDVMEALFPVSFSIADKEGYVINYLPFNTYTSTKMSDIFLANREKTIHEIEKSFQELAERQEELMSETHTLLSANNLDIYGQVHRLTSSDKKYNQDAQIHEIEDAERNSIHNSVTTSLQLAEEVILQYEASIGKHEMAHRIQLDKAAMVFQDTALADRQNIYQDAILSYTSMLSSLKRNLNAYEMVTHSMGATDKVHDSIISSVFTAATDRVRDALEIFDELNAARKASDESLLIRSILYGARSLDEALISTKVIQAVRTSKTGRIVEKVIEAVKEGRAARIVHRVLFTEKEGRGARIVHKVTRALKEFRGALNRNKVHFMDKEPDGATKPIQHVTFSEKEGHNSLKMTKLVYAAMLEDDALIRRHTVFGKLEKTMEGFINNQVILGKYHTMEAAIYKAMIQLERAEIASEVVNAILSANTKVARDTEWMEAVFADNKGEHDSWLDNASKSSSVKKASDTVVNLLSVAFNKSGHDSKWIEQTILALLSDTRREALIDRLQKLGDDIGKDTIVSTLKDAEIPDAEALIEELKLAWNKDKPNRPAGYMGETVSAAWDIGFDDLMDVWKDGWDYLDPPGKDYSYEKHKAEVYDENGVPLDPLGPINLADVDVKMPVNHPHEEYKEIGKEEAWVSLATFQDIAIQVAGLMKREKARLAEMTGHQALQEVLKQLHAYLQEASPWNAEYQRMFRFTRWYAERIAHKDSITVLHRVYENWTDEIISNGGFTHPHTIDNMAVQSSGVIESTSTVGSFEFSLENYIDGEITFSSSIVTSSASSTSKLDLYIDGVLTKSYTISDGTTRLSFEALMGSHTYRWEYTAEVGDIVKISGITVSGVKFVEAHTTQRDAASVRGLRAVDHLVQALLTYYQKHHKDKSKGAIGAYQRKIWLS